MKNYLVLIAVAIISPFIALADLNESQADYSYVDQYFEVAQKKDGTAEHIEKAQLKALNDTGRVYLSLYKIYYDSSMENISIESAEVQTNGIKTKIPKEKIIDNPVTTNGNGLTSYRVVTIPFEGVQINSTVSYQIRKKILKPQFEGAYSQLFVFGLGIHETKTQSVIKSLTPLYYQKVDPMGQLQVKSESINGFYQITVSNDKPIYKWTEKQIVSGEIPLDTLKKMTPRVLVSSNQTWTEFQNFSRAAYLKTLSEPLPNSLKTLVNTAKTKATQKLKAEEALNWVVQNITYSGRWDTSQSGFKPRSLDKIVSTKVGDCKDFATLTTKIFTELGIKSTVALVNSGYQSIQDALIRSPLDEKNSLPSSQYFNHAVVLAEIDGKKIWIDPTMGLADATTSAFYLYKQWSLPFDGSTYKMTPVEFSFGESNDIDASTTVEETIDSSFRVKSKVTLRNQMASLYRFMHYKTSNEITEQLLAALTGFPLYKAFKVHQSPLINRMSGDLNFEIELKVPKNEKSMKISYPYLPALLRTEFRQASAAEFPYKAERKTTFTNLFVPNEIQYECYSLGPVGSIQRRVTNLATNAVLKESALVKLVSSDDTMTFSDSNARSATDCYFNDQYTLSAKVENRFEDTVKEFPELGDVETSASTPYSNFIALRSYEHLFEKTKKPHYLFRMHEGVRNIGLVNNIIIPEHYSEAIKLLDQYEKLTKDQKRTNIGLAHLEFHRKEPNRLLEYFHKLYKIDPKDYRVLMIGAEVAKRRNDAQLALAYAKAAELSLKNDPDKTRLTRNLRFQGDLQCYTLKNCEDAQRLYERIISLAPNDPYQYTKAAKIDLEIKQFEKAIEKGKKALSLGDYSWVRQELIYSYVKLLRSKPLMYPKKEDVPKISEIFQEAFKLNANDDSLLYCYVEFLMGRTNVELKKEYLAEANQVATTIKRRDFNDFTMSYDILKMNLEMLEKSIDQRINFQNLKKDRVPANTDPAVKR